MDPVPDSDVTISECLCNFPYVELNICVCVYIHVNYVIIIGEK